MESTKPKLRFFCTLSRNCPAKQKELKKEDEFGTYKLQYTNKQHAEVLTLPKINFLKKYQARRIMRVREDTELWRIKRVSGCILRDKYILYFIFLPQPAQKSERNHVESLISKWDARNGSRYHWIWEQIAGRKQLPCTTFPYGKLPQLAHIFHLS